MIDAVATMPPATLAALAALEQRVVAADGGRLKLEWGTLRGRTGDAVNDLLWWDGDELAGFAGIYGFGGHDVEIAGMVDPARRRRGIGSALLAAVLPLCRERGFPRALLVTPRNDAGGAEFALSHGGRLDHSEHALHQRTPPAPAPDDPSITLRPATSEDLPALRRLFAAGFGDLPDSITDSIIGDPGTDTASTEVIVREGAVVGTLRLQVDDGVGAVYGFVVDPPLQGRGIGREALRRTCARLWADGATGVRLEVAVDNPRALGLYTSLGFEPVLTEDYYAIGL